MRKTLIFIAGGIAIFAAWQWWLSRRTNTQSKQYFDSTNASRRESSRAGARQLDAYSSLVPPLSNVVNLAGRIFNGNPIAPILTGDGDLVMPQNKTFDDVDGNQGNSTMLFGVM
jgi:hypothetical protein